MNPDLSAKLEAARTTGELLESSHDNLVQFLSQSDRPLYEKSIQWLVDQGQWKELNDRFFKRLAFGTGGLRGRSIGGVVTPAERGNAAPDARPEHPAVGTANLNFYNLTRATLGLVRHLKRSRPSGSARPSIAIARDTRHFGREFADFVAKVSTENGCDVYRFSDPRSTPELSFAVRHLNASAGIVLTASHNPPYDSGYKAYGCDGAQILGPEASAIIAEVESISGESYDPLPAAEQGQIHELGRELDEIYLDRLDTLLLDPEMVRSQSDLKIVYTNIHGTGGRITPTVLRRLGFSCETVPAQDVEDGSFPTVKSPNPENAEALQMAVEQAEASGADIVIGTDPDGDRMGVVARDRHGKMTLLTGNQIGSLMLYYRLHALTEQGIVNDSNREHAVLIKTFVTTDLQSAIARYFRVPIINTLTGFKYIGAKLRKYEMQIPEELRADYRQLSYEETRRLRLEYSRFFIFGGEESYGYLGADFLRDKDANGAAVMFAEVAAWARSRGITCVELLDELYLRHGVYLEGQHAETLAGAEGAAQIQKLALSYIEHPPHEIDGVKVMGIRDFENHEIYDEEGELIPKEKMVIIELEDGRAFAVRPSGTEPKIKFYLFQRPPSDYQRITSPESLPAAKAEAEKAFTALRDAVVADMHHRLGH